jgi:hypothetical protein
MNEMDNKYELNLFSKNIMNSNEFAEEGRKSIRSNYSQISDDFENGWNRGDKVEEPSKKVVEFTKEGILQSAMRKKKNEINQPLIENSQKNNFDSSESVS